MKLAGLLVAVIAIVTAVLGTTYWRSDVAHAQGQQQGRRQAPPPAVEAAPVKVDRITSVIDAVGTLEPAEAMSLAPEIEGTLAEILFREGTPVQAGQILVRLDDSILKAELAKARAELGLAEANFERADTLLRQRSGTQRTRDETFSALQSARASVQLAQTQLDKTVLRAPFDGVLGLRSVSKGEFVSRGDTLVTLQSIDPLKVDFRVPETQLANIRVGQKITLSTDALAGRTFEGEIYAIDPQLDVNGRALKLRALVRNQDQVLRPGLFARVGISAASRDNAIMIPESAVVPEGNSRYVFRIQEGKAQRVDVKLGQRRAGEVEVVEGLSPGDVVVTGGQQRVRAGGPVEIVNGQPGV
ncbi:hemolysin D [Skermanella stibiiresistens SB22]|uniref:Hemolysin D n=2 Tax=Skermanella TaxID=204447 RepID=W9H867_9PROT|nr:hemolysin D [Skermanella stibiiresistens SB22]